MIDHIIILFLLFSLSLIVFTNDNTISSFIMCLLIFRTRTLSDIINIIKVFGQNDLQMSVNQVQYIIPTDHINVFDIF